MAEFIERDKFRNILEAKAEMTLGTPKQVFYNTIAMLDLIPAADVVEVVRCKDCQYAKPYERNDGQMGYYCQHQNCTFLYGTNWERLFEPIKEANDFCSYGERGKDR